MIESHQPLMVYIIIQSQILI